MTQVLSAWEQISRSFVGLTASLTWRNILDIAIVTVVIYNVLKLVRQTRANSVLKGLAVVILMTWLSDLLQLNTINWLLLQVLNTGVIMLAIIFQPELRRGLEQIGRSKLYTNVFTGERSLASAEVDAREITLAMEHLSRRKVGALIVIERKTAMGEIVASGTRLDADISSQLLENIFEPNTPLHDGAVIIASGRVEAAACFLPLSEDSSISRELGTRHRAALGISETTDAVVLIASEETGIISVAREGRLQRYVDSETLQTLLLGVFAPEATPLRKAINSYSDALAAKAAKRRKGEQNGKKNS